MAKQLQIRGGTTAQHSTFTGAQREITIDTDKHTLVVHDEATAGGFPLARESVVNTALGTKVDKNANITAGTATKVTYDAKGLVTSGTNPTTISEYGITDAYTKTETNTQISTAVSNLIDSSPSTLDTLNELAAALGDDPNFATTVTNNIGTKVTKVASTDNAVVRFNGTTGEVQNSGVIIDDAGNVGIGTTTDNGVDKLQVNGSISDSVVRYISHSINTQSAIRIIISVPENTGSSGRLEVIRTRGTQTFTNTVFGRQYNETPSVNDIAGVSAKIVTATQIILDYTDVDGLYDMYTITGYVTKNMTVTITTI